MWPKSPSYSTGSVVTVTQVVVFGTTVNDCERIHGSSVALSCVVRASAAQTLGQRRPHTRRSSSAQSCRGGVLAERGCCRLVMPQLDPQGLWRKTWSAWGDGSVQPSLPGSVRTCHERASRIRRATRLCHIAFWRVTDCPE